MAPNDMCSAIKMDAIPSAETMTTSPTAVISQSSEDNEGYLPVDLNYSTKAIHSGYIPSETDYRAVVPPIVLATTYEQFAPAEPKKFEYSRSDNPTREVLQKSLASLDDGKYALCFASGLGVLTAIVSLLESGDHILCIDDVYGGTNRYLNKLASKFKIATTFFNFSDLKKLPDVIQPKTRLVWLECPTNPLMKVVDIKAISKIIKSINKDILIAVDNTFLTSYFQKPLNLGADVTVYSLTKYMNGHSDVIMGAAVVNDEKLHEDLKYIQNSAGIVPSSFDCYLVDRSLKTLKLRMREHMLNGLKVANFLEAHSLVDGVLHPGLKSHPGYDIAKKQWSGCSGMLSFYLKGNAGAVKTFLKNLKYFLIAESLGGFESLAEVPAIMTHASVPPDMRKTLGITDNLIRLSVGLEAAEDLIEDLNQALRSIKVES